MKNIIKKDFYQNIVENLNEGIIICDSSLAVTYVNKAFENISGLKASDVYGKGCIEFIKLGKNSCPICSRNLNSAYIPEQFIHQAEISDKDGNRIPVKVSHSIIKDEEEKEYITTISLLNDSLCLNQAHMDFVSTVSHELRTPLTSIKGFADTLLSAGDRLPKEQQIRFINIIKSQVDRLARLVENLLTVSRLETRKDMSISRSIDLKKILEPVIQGIKAKAPEHIFVLDIAKGLPEIWADSDKFEQVMINLIDNAAKYSYPKSEVRIKAAFTPNNPDYIDINIIDQGVGIPEEHLEKIFTKFSRIDNPLTREVQGTGLGLYITKSLVENMNGNIFVSSNDKGTTFTVRMPVATCERQTAKNFK